MIGRTAIVAAAAFGWTDGQATAADVALGGIPIGTSVTLLAQSRGLPTDVASEDSGNRFVFSDGTTVYVDDDGIVLAVALAAGNPQISVDDRLRRFPIGTYRVEQADAELAAAAEFSTTGLRSYRLAPRRDLVLSFDAAQRLARVTYGEPGQLVRLGLLPGDAAARAVVYRAPRARKPVTGSTAMRSSAVYRISIDRAGEVSAVDVTIPATRDQAEGAPVATPLAGQLKSERYAPALLDGRPIAATIFARVNVGTAVVGAGGKP